jgi:predicted TIM-barrel fold metal-dependent hydrolase
MSTSDYEPLPFLSSFDETAASGPLIDHHCHGVVRDDLDRGGFEMYITESFWPAPSGTSHFNSPMGFAIRRWCAPLLDLEPHVPAERYMERRVELGTVEVNQRLLRACGISHLLLDTGFTSSTLLSPPEMAKSANGVSAEVARIEKVAEEVAMTGVGAKEFLEAFTTELRRQAEQAIGLKSIVAYRFGLDFDPERPTESDALESVSQWFQEGNRARVENSVVLRWLLWEALDVARERSLPIQFHVGYGDSDLEMHRCNPLKMTAFIRSTVSFGVPIMLLHCYPYEREAGYLAEVFPHVYLDVGSIVHYTGAESHRVVAHSLELAPFHKLLFSSDAYALPELYVVGTALFLRGLDRALTRWVDQGDCSSHDARAITALVRAGNALRVYPGLAG